MTPVEFLAERYNYITWMRNRDEISAATADEWRAKFLKQAKEMEKKKIKIELDEWMRNCGDGCCIEYGTTTKVNGEEMQGC